MQGGPLGHLTQFQHALDEVFESSGVALAYLYGSVDTQPLRRIKHRYVLQYFQQEPRPGRF